MPQTLQQHQTEPRQSGSTHALTLGARKGWSGSPIVAAILLLTLTACNNKPKEAETEPVVPVQVAEVKRDSIQRIVTAQAILFPVDQASVVPKISAPVRSFAVRRGDHVTKGQLLATLENRDLQASVSDGKATFEQAESALRTTTSATVPEDTNKAQQEADTDRQNMEAAQRVYESRKQLFDQGALARRLVDEANTAYVQAKSQYEIAQKHLQSVQGVTRQEQVKTAQAQVESARAKFEGAQAQLSYSEIRSPIAGVIADRPLFAGEMAAAGTPLLVVMDVSRVIARANIPVGQAGSVKVGNSAGISQTDASLESTGRVTVVSPAVDPNSTTVEVWVEAPNPGEKFKPGATVRVSILAETIPNAIVIPVSALLPSQEGGTQVMTVGADGQAHEKKIEIGVQEPEKVQIVKGLEPGEKVITVGGVGLEDGAKVKIRGPNDKPEKEDKGDKGDKDDKKDDKPGKDKDDKADDKK